MPSLDASEARQSDGKGSQLDSETLNSEIIETSSPGQHDEESFAGLGRLLKQNPSLQFCREVVQMNKEELDPAEVRKVGSHLVDCCTMVGKYHEHYKVERKIDWLIIPALAVCYGFYYM